MFKSAGLLLLLGLAIGLWLGFNPQAHQKVVQSWDNTKSFFARLETNFSTSIGAWTMQAKSQVNVSPKTVSGVTAKSFGTAWRQFVSAWSTFLGSLQRIWHELVSNINLNRS